MSPWEPAQLGMSTLCPSLLLQSRAGIAHSHGRHPSPAGKQSPKEGTQTVQAQPTARDSSPMVGMSKWAQTEPAGTAVSPQARQSLWDGSPRAVLRPQQPQSLWDGAPHPVGWQPHTQGCPCSPPRILGTPQHGWDCACCKVRGHRTSWAVLGRVPGISPSHTPNTARHWQF